MSQLREKYQQEVMPQLQKELKLANVLATPKVVKVVLNLGLGEAVQDKGIVEKASESLAQIAGQKPQVAQARVSISGFKLRAGMPIGLKVTLRGQRMYNFLEKLFKVVLPRLRDFRGVSRKSFDGQGNYNLGLAEQTVFPEVDFEKLDKVRGLQITIVTNADDQVAAERLLELLGMPFEKKE